MMVGSSTSVQHETAEGFFGFCWNAAPGFLTYQTGLVTLLDMNALRSAAQVQSKILACSVGSEFHQMNYGITFRIPKVMAVYDINMSTGRS